MSGAEPCRKFNSRRTGNAVYRTTGKPTFNTTPICGPKPCPIPEQTRNASGDCICPPGQEEISGKCVAFCPSDRKRVGLDCVCNEGFLPGKDGKCYKKVECVSPETPNLDFTFCECKAPYVKNPTTGKCEGLSKCVYPMTLNTATNKCECKGPAAVEINGKCEVVAKCGPDETLNTATNKCECKPGFTRDKSGKCCDLSKNDLINGKCLPKCATGTHREGEVCVPDAPPINLERPLTIETDVVLGGFEQSTADRTVIRQVATRSQVVIDPIKHAVKIGENLLSGIPYSIEFKDKFTGNPYTRLVNGVGKKSDNIWPLYIKNVSIKNEKIGFDNKNGISVEFYPVTANKIDKTPGKPGPTPVFIEIKPDSDGKVTCVQNNKTVYTTASLMLETLKSALMPLKTGGRKTTKRKHKYTRKSRKNNRKSRKQQRKTKNNRRK